MALGAVRAERAIVLIVLAMAIDAGWRGLFEISHGADVGVTASAVYFAVFTAEREREAIVIKAREPINAVVTSKAILSKIGDVPRNEIGLIVTMARFAPRPIERADVIAVAIGTGKRLPVRSMLVRGERERQSIMWKVLG